MLKHYFENNLPNYLRITLFQSVNKLDFEAGKKGKKKRKKGKETEKRKT